MFNPSEKQTNGLLNMYKFLGYGDDVMIPEFETRDEFQTLFETLQKKCSQHKIIKSKIQYAKENNINLFEKKKKKIEEYYSSKENLEKYRIKYYDKYKVSAAKLKEKLLKKNKNIEFANEISDKVAWQNENSLIEKLILWFFQQGKPIDFIYKKLRDKRFFIKKDEIEDIIKEFDYKDEYKDIQEQKIIKLINSFWPEKLQDYNEKSKLIKKLMWKWFNYSIIKKVIYENY